jgi:hypothetical protein
MSRFKFGLVLGFAAGWLVATGRAAELLEQARKRFVERHTAPASDANGVYDFAVRAAAQ